MVPSKFFLREYNNSYRFRNRLIYTSKRHPFQYGYLYPVDLRIRDSIGRAYCIPLLIKRQL